MFSNRHFRIALIISLITHATIFFKPPQLTFLPLRRKLNQIQLSYIREKDRPLSSRFDDKISPLKSSRQASSKELRPVPIVKKEQIFKEVKNIPIKKPDFFRPEIIAVKKKITMPEFPDKKLTDPAYLDYYQTIRERIKRAAYQNYTRLVNGEVYLSFIILNNGQIKDTKINEEKSSLHSYLKEIAEKSIYDASPFPNFPKDLNFPELSFNVIISFEVE